MLPPYGTDTTTSASERSERDNSSNLEEQEDQQHPDNHSDEIRQRLLGNAPNPNMTLADVLYAYDLTGAQLLYQNFGRSHWLRMVLELLSHTSDGILWFLMVLPVIIIMWFAGLLDGASQASKTVFIVFYTCMVVDIIAIVMMKMIFKRARPPHHQSDRRFVGPDKLSFPSGHATRSWCIVAFILDLGLRYPSIVREVFHMPPSALNVLVLLWGLAIAFSRVALGRHYPSDIIAGALIGAFILYPVAVFGVHNFTSLANF